jgi:hypothetical protein
MWLDPLPFSEVIMLAHELFTPNYLFEHQKFGGKNHILGLEFLKSLSQNFLEDFKVNLSWGGSNHVINWRPMRVIKNLKLVGHMSCSWRVDS